MDTTKVLRGDDIMLFVGGKSIAFGTSHTLTMTSEVTAINCKDSGVWTDNKVNKLSWEIQADYLYSDGAFSDVKAKWIARTPIVAYFGKTDATDQEKSDGINSPTESWDPATAYCSWGNVVISNLTVTAASGDNATFSATLTGVGQLH